MMTQLLKPSIFLLLLLPVTVLKTSAQATNPTLYAQGFNVFTQNSVTFQAGDTHGPVATGGDLYLNGNTIISMNYAGTYPFGTNNANNYGLVVAGRIFYTSGNESDVNQGYLRLGNANGTTLYDVDQNNAACNLRATSGGYNNQTRLQVQRLQSSSSAMQSSGINFAAAFTQFVTNAAIINNYPNSINCAASFYFIPVPTTNNPQITLQNGVINYLNLTQAQLSNLNNLGSIIFTNHPDATHLLIINVTGSGSYSWTTPNIGGLSESDGAWILNNFSGLTSLTLAGSNPIYGTIYAPAADLAKTNPNNSNGQIIAKSYAIVNGETHYYPFTGNLPTCSNTPSSNINNVSNTPLALKSIQLKAGMQDGKIQLGWDVIGEENVLQYNAEKSDNGSDFRSIGIVNGLGLSGDHHYSLVDTEPAASKTVYYRIKAISLDGSFAYSNVTQYRLDVASAGSSVSVWPNPFSNTLHITSGAGFENGTKMMISDIAGRALISKTVAQGAVYVSISESAGLQNGVYILSISSLNGNTVKNLRIVKGE